MCRWGGGSRSSGAGRPCRRARCGQGEGGDGARNVVVGQNQRRGDRRCPGQGLQDALHRQGQVAWARAGLESPSFCTTCGGIQASSTKASRERGRPERPSRSRWASASSRLKLSDGVGFGASSSVTRTSPARSSSASRQVWGRRDGGIRSANYNDEVPGHRPRCARRRRAGRGGQAPTGCSGGTYRPRLHRVLSATSSRAENGGRAGQSRIAASDNSCRSSGNSYLRALTGGYADNALNVVPFSSWLVTPTPGSNPRGCPVARSAGGILRQVCSGQAVSRADDQQQSALVRESVLATAVPVACGRRRWARLEN